MRKGILLAEVLVWLAVFTSVLVVFAPMLNTIFRHIPRSYKAAQENTQVLDMLEQMRKDIERAEQLPLSYADHTTDAGSLLIELGDGVVRYQLQEGKVIRSKLADARNGGPDTPMVWSAPHAKVRWAVWEKTGRAYAVEVQTHIDYPLGRRSEKKLANSHVYFMGAFREALKR
jgi:type II secretory pathway component PulJ